MFRNLFAVALMVWTGAALAHDHNCADLSKWFEQLHDRKGDLCGDGSEAMHLSEVDWEIDGNRYRVRVPTTSGGFQGAWPAQPMWKPSGFTCPTTPSSTSRTGLT
jgi:hypothetical protein